MGSNGNHGCHHVAWGEAKGITNGWMESAQLHCCTGWVITGSPGLGGEVSEELSPEEGHDYELHQGDELWTTPVAATTPMWQGAAAPCAVAQLAGLVLPPLAQLIKALGSFHIPPADVKHQEKMLSHVPLAHLPFGRTMGCSHAGQSPPWPSVSLGRIRAALQVSRDRDPFGNTLLASNKL